MKSIHFFLLILFSAALTVTVMGDALEGGAVYHVNSNNDPLSFGTANQDSFENQSQVQAFEPETGYPENSPGTEELTLNNESDFFMPENISPVTSSSTTLVSILTPYTHQFLPRIFGSWIVWFNDDSGDYRIHYYNISDGTERKIMSECQADYGIVPNIDKSRIVWQGYDGQNTSIHLYDIETDSDRIIISDPVSIPSSPDLYGDVVVWSEWRYENADIFLQNITTGEELLLTPGTNGTAETSPSIYGDKVVWQNENPETYTRDIYLCNITSGETILITPFTPDSSEEFPCIYDHFVSFQRMGQDLRGDILLYDLDKSETINLTPGSPTTNEDSPYIFGDNVVWSGQNPETGTTDIYHYNLTTGKTYILNPDTTDTSQYFPSVYENRVVWQQEDKETGYLDIFMMTLGADTPPLTAEFGVNTVAGEVPFTVLFSDQSSGDITGWLWDFGDGNVSRDKDPEHTYLLPGSYTVSLIVNNAFQRSGVLKENLVSAGSPPLVSFSSDVCEGPAPLTVRFSDTSVWAPESWHWEFGDGAESIEQDPEHIYRQPGCYNVTLTATNTFGPGTKEEIGAIEVREGIRRTIPLNLDGVEIIANDSGQMVSLNSSSFLSFSIEPGLIELYPANEPGIQKIVLYTSDASGFQWKDQNLISGYISSLMLTSKDFFIDYDAYNFSFQFEDNMTGYPVNGTYTCEFWEGTTQRDYRRFNEIAITGNPNDQGWSANASAGVNSVAFTGHITDENITNPGPATLIFGLNSDWISDYGWAYGYEVTSDPPGIRCYLDGKFIGHTPLEIPGAIPSGNHTLVLRDSHYVEQTRVLVIDKKPSIRVIRIGEDGAGDVLETEFLYHDDERNMDFFRVYSLKGLSTFGLVSTSRGGNPFQMLYLVLSRLTSQGGGGGGGGGGNDNEVASSANPQTFIPTKTQTPALTPLPTVTPVKGITDLPGSPKTPTSVIPTIIEEPSITPDNIGQGGTSALVLLRNLSVVSVVVIVTVIFYFRWKKTEE